MKTDEQELSEKRWLRRTFQVGEQHAHFAGGWGMMHCRWNLESKVSFKYSEAVRVSWGQITGTCRPS